MVINCNKAKPSGFPISKGKATVTSCFDMPRLIMGRCLRASWGFLTPMACWEFKNHGTKMFSFSQKPPTWQTKKTPVCWFLFNPSVDHKETTGKSAIELSSTVAEVLLLQIFKTPQFSSHFTPGSKPNGHLFGGHKTLPVVRLKGLLRPFRPFIPFHLPMLTRQLQDCKVPTSVETKRRKKQNACWNPKTSGPLPTAKWKQVKHCRA